MNSYSIIVIILISFIPIAFADLQSDRDLLLERGMTFYRAEKYDLAISSFDKILELDPNDIEVLLKKIQLLFKLENFDEGMSYIDKALEVEPNNIDALTYKSYALLLLNNTSGAKPFYEKIITLDPQNVAALGYIGDEFIRNGNTEQALLRYEKVVDLQPYRTDPFDVAYFDKLLEIRPDDVNSLNAKGTSMVKLGRSEGGFTVIYIDKLDEAISYFDRAIEIAPDNVDSLLNKGKALFQLGKGDEGMEYVDRALTIDPDNVDILTFKGDELLRANQTDQGTKFIERALEIEPKNVDALFLKGRTLVFQENYNDAFYYFDEVLELNPNHLVAAENIKYIADILGKKKLDGFLDVMIHDSQGLLAGHLRVNDLQLLNHTLAESIINEWPVTQIITRNGQDYEVLQHHITQKIFVPKYNGGASHYGIKYPHYDNVWDVHANYWMYRVQKGDTVDFVYTVFRPVV